MGIIPEVKFKIFFIEYSCKPKCLTEGPVEALNNWPGRVHILGILLYGNFQKLVEQTKVNLQKVGRAEPALNNIRLF